MHHPKLFATLFLSLFPAFAVYAIGTGVSSVDSAGWGILAFLVSCILIYGLLALREGVRELRALRIAYERSLPPSESGRPYMFQSD